MVFIFLGVFAALMVFFGLMLRRGRCLWLIAGYNTASKETKAQYDGLKLGRVMSRLMFAVAGFICVVGFMGWLYDHGRLGDGAMSAIAILLVAALIALIAVTAHAANTKCKK